jgi:hypothetical protein
VFDLSENEGRFLVARRLTRLRPVPWTRLQPGERMERAGEYLAILARWHERGMTVPPGLNSITIGPEGGVLLAFPGALDLYVLRKRLHVSSPEYLPCAAPEELGGEGPSRAEESYRLGALLFHALADRPPRQGRTARELRRAALTPAPDLREIVPEIPAPVAELIARLLSGEPHARPEVAEAAALWSSAAARRGGPSDRRRPRRRPRAPAPPRAVQAPRAPQPPRAVPGTRATPARRPAPRAGPMLTLARRALFVAGQVGIFFLSSWIAYLLLSLRSMSEP